MLCTMHLFVLLAVHVSVSALEFSLRNYEKTEYMDTRISPYIKSFGARSKSDCAVACEQTDKCIAFNINVDGRCEIMRYNPNDQLTSSVKEIGWTVYSQHQIQCWPAGYDGFVRDGMCYFWKQSEDTLPWADCQYDCRSHGAELVCIESQEENDALVAAVPMWLWWFGLNDLDNDGVFTCNEIIPAYKNWAEDKPENDLCVAVYGSGTQQWHDGGCNADIAYVCEKKWY